MTTTSTVADAPRVAETRTERFARHRAFIAACGFDPVPYGLRAACPVCRVKAGQRCVTRTDGRPLRHIHLRRQDASRQAHVGRVSKLLLLEDDPRFGLAAGDVLIGHPYPLDSKWTIVRRESDGYDPGCNQYSSDVAWLDWA